LLRQIAKNVSIPGGQSNCNVDNLEKSELSLVVITDFSHSNKIRKYDIVQEQNFIISILKYLPMPLTLSYCILVALL